MISDTLLVLEDHEVPEILHIGCSHPLQVEITNMKDKGYRRFTCPRYGCYATWMEKK